MKTLVDLANQWEARALQLMNPNGIIAYRTCARELRAAECKANAEREELLEACRKLIDTGIVLPFSNQGGSEFADAIVNAKKAIAKVEGNA